MDRLELNKLMDKKRQYDDVIHHNNITIDAIKQDGIKIHTWKGDKMIDVKDELTQGQYNVIEDMVISFIEGNVNIHEEYIKEITNKYENI